MLPRRNKRSAANMSDLTQHKNGTHLQSRGAVELRGLAGGKMGTGGPDMRAHQKWPGRRFPEVQRPTTAAERRRLASRRCGRREACRHLEAAQRRSAWKGPFRAMRSAARSERMSAMRIEAQKGAARPLRVRRPPDSLIARLHCSEERTTRSADACPCTRTVLREKVGEPSSAFHCRHCTQTKSGCRLR